MVYPCIICFLSGCLITMICFMFIMGSKYELLIKQCRKIADLTSEIIMVRERLAEIRDICYNLYGETLEGRIARIKEICNE